jgi:hypothetical protein
MAYDIRLVKLITGDMALGKWDENDKKLKDIAVIQTIPTQSGGVQMMLMPFGYPFETEITGEISFDHVIYIYKTFPDDLKNKYLEASSNLTLSSPGDLERLKNMGGPGGKPGGKSGISLIK